jgi:hypothetical protein
VCALALVALPASAFASPAQVHNDCGRDGRLDREYSNEDLRKARDDMPTDLLEYSECQDVIAAAIQGGSDRGSGEPSPGVGNTDPAGETAARDEDVDALSTIAEAGEAPKVDVGGTSLEPDSNGFFDVSGAANSVPLPLVLALVLLGLLALFSGIGALRERVPAIARVPLLSKIPTPRVPFLNRRR